MSFWVSKARNELFGRTRAGAKGWLGGRSFRVIGVIEPKGDMLGFDLDDIAYIPADLALELFNQESHHEIDLTFVAGAGPVESSGGNQKRLIDRHGREDFTLTTQDQMLNSLNSILGAHTGRRLAPDFAVGGLGRYRDHPDHQCAGAAQ